MNKTAIEWCDRTWNPVTGCLYGCDYCYAEKQAKRYNPKYESVKAAARYVGIGKNGLYDIAEPWEYDNRILAHPFGFAPTFHRYRLERPQLVKKPQNVFVCSMADLFGEWVPDEWINAVFEACEKAPQHRYLFLTKNPDRYQRLDRPPYKNFWFGSSITDGKTPFHTNQYANTFVSIEPLLKDIGEITHISVNWIIIGAETGNRKGKVIPKRKWVENIISECRLHGIPVFMKDSLKKIWGKPLIRQYPWEEERNGNV